MSFVTNHLRFAVRQFSKAREFSLTAVFALSLGATLLLFAILAASVDPMQALRIL
jgi:hypothetical protein